jgi:uncharacterized protein YjeT (DUF2065 family)
LWYYAQPGWRQPGFFVSIFWLSAMQDLLVALCLVLVLEGLIPTLAPTQWRKTVLSLLNLSDRQIRVGGLICMLAGAFLLSIVH